MARLILDTSVLVDAEHQEAAALDKLLGDEDDVAIAAITAAELAVGVDLAEGERRAKRQAFVAALLEAVSVESYDLEVAQAHGALLAHIRRSGRPCGAHDLIIAASARGREVVSGDVDGFSDLPGVTVHTGGGER